MALLKLNRCALLPLLAVAVLVGAPGCIWPGTEETPFPEGLEPLEDSEAPAPQADGEDFPETFNIVTGDAGDYIWVHLSGFIHAPPADVWRAIQEPRVVADRRNTTRMEVTYDVEPNYDYMFEIHYEEDRIITVEWNEYFRYGAIEGTFEEPAFGMMRWQKVWGSTFIDLIEGQISVTEAAPGISHVTFVEHLAALEEKQGVIAGYMTDIYNNIQAFLANEPLPEY